MLKHVKSAFKYLRQQFEASQSLAESGAGLMVRSSRSRFRVSVRKRDFRFWFHFGQRLCLFLFSCFVGQSIGSFYPSKRGTDLSLSTNENTKTWFHYFAKSHHHPACHGILGILKNGPTNNTGRGLLLMSRGYMK